MERKIQTVHRRLDAFELGFLARPSPTIGFTTLQEAVASLRADVDIILEIGGPEPESAPIEIAEDTILVALFTAPTAPP